MVRPYSMVERRSVVSVSGTWLKFSLGLQFYKTRLHQWISTYVEEIKQAERDQLELAREIELQESRCGLRCLLLPWL